LFYKLDGMSTSKGNHWDAAVNFDTYGLSKFAAASRGFTESIITVSINTAK